MTDYLTSAPVIATSSLEAAREAVARVYLVHDLQSADGVMDMRLNAVEDRHMTLGYLTYGADAELTMPPTEDCYIVNLTVAGRTRATRRGGVEGRTAASWPGARTRAGWGGWRRSCSSSRSTRTAS